MGAYSELRARIAELEEQAAIARASEVAEVLADIRAKVAEFGLTVEDVFGESLSLGASKKRVHEPLPPKYRDPVTGATWSGRGRAPSWIANVTNRDRFLLR
ncbi:MAG: H-NS histone family protein [Paraburkholderia tropica]|uniref:H-NS histone family protein n=1 Tax=Paraburkholderia tropica TaxID=92647 RepID=UPI003100C4A8